MLTLYLFIYLLYDKLNELNNKEKVINYAYIILNYLLYDKLNELYSKISIKYEEEIE